MTEKSTQLSNQIEATPQVVLPVRGKRTSHKRTGLVMAVVATSALVGFGGGMLGYYVADQTSSTNSAASRQIISDESQLISTIASEVGQSVVSINVTSTATQRDFFGRTYSSDQQSAGTGVIVSDSGYILTNRHVVQGADKVSVTLSNGTVLDDVKVVGVTGESDSLDIAMLKINDKKDQKLVAAKLGKSSSMDVGDKVVAIGNALGRFQNTVTTGIISGYGRSIEASSGTGSDVEVLQNLIQTDAAINSGNSGGPLVNLNGEVIGINTAVASGTAQNIGFAIPIDDINGLVQRVIKSGKFERPFLGVRYISLDAQVAEKYGLDVTKGAYLAPNEEADVIASGSPADKAGLKVQDIITKVGGTVIDDRNTLGSLIGRQSVGDKVELVVVRNGSERTVTVVLEAYK